jgi:hypothetical protein
MKKENSNETTVENLDKFKCQMVCLQSKALAQLPVRLDAVLPSVQTA